MVVQTTCSVCKGAGKIPEKACARCDGTGHDPIVDSIKLKVPSGIDTGQKLRVAGKGLEGEPGAKNGDAYVRVFVDQSEKFRRDGLDIHANKEISLKQACLGCNVKIETIHGEISLEIPPGVQPGDACVIEKSGIIHRMGNEVGSHVIHINVKIPTDLTDEQKIEVRNLSF